MSSFSLYITWGPFLEESPDCERYALTVIWRSCAWLTKSRVRTPLLRNGPLVILPQWRETKFMRAHASHNMLTTVLQAYKTSENLLGQNFITPQHL